MLIKSIYVFKALFLLLLIIPNIVDFSFIFLPLWYGLNQPNGGEGTEWEKGLENCQEKYSNKIPIQFIFLAFFIGTELNVYSLISFSSKLCPSSGIE